MTSINFTSEFDRFLGTIGNFEYPQFLELDGHLGFGDIKSCF